MEKRNSSFLHQSNCLIAVVVDDGEGIYTRDLKSAWSSLSFSIDDNGDSKRKEFVIGFHTDEHGLQFVMENRPWVFQKKIIAVHRPHAIAAEGDLYVSPMWVQFEVPPMWYHQYQYPYQDAAYLGHIVGRPMVREDGGMIIFENISASSMRVKVEVDLKLPLIQKIKLLSTAGDVWIQCTYEGVYRHCKKCGRIGHVANACKFNNKANKSEVLNKLKERIREKGYEDIDIDIKDEKPRDRRYNAVKHTACIRWRDGEHRVTYEYDPRAEVGGPSSTASANESASCVQQLDDYSSAKQNLITGTDEPVFAGQMNNVVAADNYNPQLQVSYFDQISQQNGVVAVQNNPNFHGIDKEDPIWDFDNLMDFDNPIW